MSVFFAASLHANSSGKAVREFTLPEVVQYAAEHYPAVRAAVEQKNVAQAAISLARDSYMPKADMLWQVNRATRNNVAGVLLPQATMPNPSGPVLDSSRQSLWGSAAGFQIPWEPFDFGYRHAVVQSAQASARLANEQIALTLLDVQIAAADAALSLLAAEQSVHAMQADVDRRTVFDRSVRALVDAQMRPGADASRSAAELAAARTQLILAQQNVAVAKAFLAELLGLAGDQVEIIPGALLHFPEKISVSEMAPIDHPLAVVAQDRVLESKARVHILDRAYAPKFDVQALGYGRGSGAMGTGKLSPDTTRGLLPDTENWAAGVPIKFAIFDFATIRT